MLKSAILKSYSGKNKNAFLLSPNAPYYDSELRIWMNTNVLAEQIRRRSVLDYQVIDTLIEQKNEIFILGDQPVHHLFLTTIAVEIYDFAKLKGASSNGALLVLAQASLESGYGSSALKNGDYNLFGVMGKPSKRSTSHGSVKDYSNLGGYKAALTDYFSKIEKNWSYFSTIISKNTITADDIDKAFNTGTYYPTDKERHSGKYAYNADKDKSGKNHYGEYLLKQLRYIKIRFRNSLEFQIKSNKNRIIQINYLLLHSLIITNLGKMNLEKEKTLINIQNVKFTSILNETF
jgi:hypothetical protein